MVNDRKRGRFQAPVVQVIRRGAPAADGAPAVKSATPLLTRSPAPAEGGGAAGGAGRVVPRPGPTAMKPSRLSDARSPLRSATAARPLDGATTEQGATAADATDDLKERVLGSVPSPGRASARGGPRTGAPRPPPTNEAILALAQRERVPNRIAKGDLEGKMLCRIWKKLHQEEARRFEEAWTLVERHAGLALADAFGAVQSGLPPDEFLARRARVKRKDEVKQARASVAGATVDELLAGLVKGSTELAFVLADRVVVDAIAGIQPVAFDLKQSGLMPKLGIVLIARASTWERLGPGLEREPSLAAKPTAVARQPARRPISDPRPLLPLVEQTLRVELRNGLVVTGRLAAVGPFDVVIGELGDELVIPLHAMLRWSQPAPAGERAPSVAEAPGADALAG